jgi:hypothetical protein
VTDKEGVFRLVDEDPIGAMRLGSSVLFGQRAAALSGGAGTTDPAGVGVFQAPGSFGWPWPDHPTCSSLTL